MSAISETRKAARLDLIAATRAAMATVSAQVAVAQASMVGVTASTITSQKVVDINAALSAAATGASSQLTALNTFMPLSGED